MDRPEYTSLQAALAAVPDPRCARGQRYPWPLLLTLIAAALAGGQRSLRAIGQWVGEHAEDLSAALDPPRGRLPSPATLRRAVQAVDVLALEDRVATFVAGLPVTPPIPAAPPLAPAAPPPARRRRWAGWALDGKAVRGANRHGARLHLVSLVRHADAAVLGQVAVAHKSNEITAAPRLLAGRALDGVVITMDALLTQRALATQILVQQGHYLMVVKANQPTLFADLERLFTGAPLLPWPSDAAETATTVGKGHGRLEARTLERTAALTGYLDWPGVGQVARRTCRRVIIATGEVQDETTYGVTSLPVAAASAADVEALWRGHWTIENRVHYPRDVTLGEDAGQQRVGRTPQALAALRNGLLSLWRALGWASIADAVRHYQASAQRAVRLLALTPAHP